MKKLFLLLIFIVPLICSCSKDGLQNMAQLTDPMFENGAISSFAAVIEVYPGVDDTQALLDAFNEAATFGKGTVVKLMPGIFRIRMIEIKEFFGVLTGSGKGNTIITNLANIPKPDDVIALKKLPALIKFIGGDVTMTNLTVQLTYMPWLGLLDFNMLMFSDYSMDFMPSDKYIRIRLNNLEIKGISNPAPPYFAAPVLGTKIAPDIQRNAEGVFPRGNVDASISNCIISDFANGITVWGCKKGNIDIGTEGGNVFEKTGRGLSINENIGVHVKILNNKFIQIPEHGNILDINTGETVLPVLVNSLEVPKIDAGTYEIRNNLFDITGPNAAAIGLMDTWRVAHPENPTWMKMNWQFNTFVLKNMGWIGSTYCIKDISMTNNTFAGDDMQWSVLLNTNLYWRTDLPNNISENCKLINNHFIRKNVGLILDVNVNNWQVMGDLSNLMVNDFGENNIILGKTNTNHANGTLDMDFASLKESGRNILLQTQDK
jgi:hypothetical protein